MNASCKSLAKSMENVDESNIEEIVYESMKLLKEMKSSTTIDYNVEKELVSEIYELVYQALKLELIYTNNSS